MPAIEFEDLKLLGFDIDAYLADVTYLDGSGVFHPKYGLYGSEESLQSVIISNYIREDSTPYEEWVSKQEPVRRLELERLDWLEKWQMKVRYLQFIIASRKFKDTGNITGEMREDFHCKACGKNCGNKHNLEIHSERCKEKQKPVDVEVVLEPADKSEVRPCVRSSTV